MLCRPRSRAGRLGGWRRRVLERGSLGQGSLGHGTAGGGGLGRWRLGHWGLGGLNQRDWGLRRLTCRAWSFGHALQDPSQGIGARVHRHNPDQGEGPVCEGPLVQETYSRCGGRPDGEWGPAVGAYGLAARQKLHDHHPVQAEGCQMSPQKRMFPNIPCASDEQSRCCKHCAGERGDWSPRPGPSPV